MRCYDCLEELVPTNDPVYLVHPISILVLYKCPGRLRGYTAIPETSWAIRTVCYNNDTDSVSLATADLYYRYPNNTYWTPIWDKNR